MKVVFDGTGLFDESGFDQLVFYPHDGAPNREGVVLEARRRTPVSRVGGSSESGPSSCLGRRSRRALVCRNQFFSGTTGEGKGSPGNTSPSEACRVSMAVVMSRHFCLHCSEDCGVFTVRVEGCAWG